MRAARFATAAVVLAVAGGCGSQTDSSEAGHDAAPGDVTDTEQPDLEVDVNTDDDGDGANNGDAPVDLDADADVEIDGGADSGCVPACDDTQVCLDARCCFAAVEHGAFDLPAHVTWVDWTFAGGGISELEYAVGIRNDPGEAVGLYFAPFDGTIDGTFTRA